MVNPGDIAFCQHKQLGLITRVHLNTRTYTTTYHGIQLDPERFGRPWQSTLPQVIGNLHAILSSENSETGESKT